MWESEQVILPSSSSGQEWPDSYYRPDARPISGKDQADALSAMVGVWHATLYGLALWALLLIGGIVLWRML